MSSDLTAALPQRSVDASLAEVDGRTKEPGRLLNASFDVGPFSVFSLSDSPTPHPSLPPITSSQEVEQPIDFSNTSISDLDSLLDVGNVLGWNDLFDTGLDFTSPSYHEQSDEDPLALLARVASQPNDRRYEDHSGDLSNLDAMDLGNPQIDTAAPFSHTHTEMADVEILSYGQVLLTYFKNVIVPNYSPLPMNSKSPWETMNCYAAVQTLADMTYLQTPDVKHANKANLFGAIACSAYTIVQTQTYLADLPAPKCLQIVNCASTRAKKHMKDSLSTETRGPKKAKYKDQLMAINTLIALAVLSFFPLCRRNQSDEFRPLGRIAMMLAAISLMPSGFYGSEAWPKRLYQGERVFFTTYTPGYG